MIKDKNSYLNLWKSLAALTMVDGVYTPEEEKFVSEFLAQAKITDEERQAIKEVISSDCSPYDFVDQITDVSHLSQLHHLANILFNKDGFDVKEGAFLNKFQKYIEKKVDPLNATRKMQDYLRENEESRKKDMEKAEGFFASLIQFYRK